MYKTLRVLIGFAVICLVNAAQAQNIGNTPYSRYGLGEYNYNLGNVRNAGMAGVGVSAGNSYQANTANPALLYYNSITVFDMGIAGEVKSIKNDKKNQLDSNASLYNLALAVPISKRWSAAVGLRPYTTVNYETRAISKIQDNPRATIERRYTGEGGLSELYFGHGVKVATGLTLGASASYVFGTIAKEAGSLVIDDSLANIGQTIIVYSERTRYDSFLFRAGANYRKQLKEKLNISAGAVYSLSTEFDADRNSSYERRTLFNNVIDENILPDSSNSNVNVPSSLRAGVAIDNGSNLTLGADVYMQKWSEYKGFDGRHDLVDSYRVSVGGEYTPNANSIDSYLQRITYRAGLYYGNSPYEINGEQIKDKGITAGATMPLGRSTIYDMYQLNAAIGYGNRGTTEKGLVAENYFQFKVGFTVNSRWFIKRRIE